MSGAITANNPRIGYRTFAVFGTVTADEEDPNYPITNAVNPATYLQWRATSNAEQSIYFTLPEAQAADYIAVFGHNWGSRNTTVTVEYSLDGVVWLPAYGPTIPDADDTVFFREFEQITTDLWRIRLEPTGDSLDDPPEASLIYIGEVLVLPRRIYVGHTPLPMGRATELSTGVSTSGQFLGRVLESVSYDTQVQMDFVTPEFIRDEFDPFVRACIDRPFFWSWRPQRYDDEAGLAWFSGSSVPRPQNSRENGWMSFSFSMQGVTLPPHIRTSTSGES